MLALFSFPSRLISELLVLNGFGLGGFGLKLIAVDLFSNVFLLELSEAFFFLNFITSSGFFQCLPESPVVYKVQQSVSIVLLGPTDIAESLDLPA